MTEPSCLQLNMEKTCEI